MSPALPEGPIFERGTVSAGRSVFEEVRTEGSVFEQEGSAFAEGSALEEGPFFSWGAAANPPVIIIRID